SERGACRLGRSPRAERVRAVAEPGRLLARRAAVRSRLAPLRRVGLAAVRRRAPDLDVVRLGLGRLRAAGLDLPPRTMGVLEPVWVGVDSRLRVGTRVGRLVLG